MSEDGLPTDGLRRLADDAGAAAEPPKFTGLALRGRRRRRVRRTTTGVGGLAAVAAVVAAAITVPGQVEGGPTEPAPTSGHSPQPTSSSTSPSRHYLLHHPAALVNQPDAHMVYVSYADPQHAAALWEVCDSEDCPEVVTWTSDGWSTSRASVIPDKLAIYPLHDGSVVVWLYGAHSFVLDPDGGRHPITVSHTPIARRPSGSLTNLPGVNGARPVGVFDSRTDVVYPPLTSAATRCVYDDHWDPSGTIWEYGASHCGPGATLTLAWSSDLGRTWSTHRIPDQPVLGLIATTDRTAVLLGSKAKGQHDVLEDLLMTHDRGRGVWPEPVVPPSSRIEVWSDAATQDGQLFVTDGVVLWTAVDADWIHFHQVHTQGFRNVGFTVSGVETVGQDVIVYGADLLRYPNQLAVSSDDGRTWRLVSPRP